MIHENSCKKILLSLIFLEFLEVTHNYRKETVKKARIAISAYVLEEKCAISAYVLEEKIEFSAYVLENIYIFASKIQPLASYCKK